MAAGIYDIVIEQGATFNKTIVLKDSTGAVRDLTNVTSVRGQVRPSFSSTTAYDFVLAVNTPATDGEISWTMPAAVTASIEIKQNANLVYDIEMVYSDETVERILQGNATISLEVTRD